MQQTVAGDHEVVRADGLQEAGFVPGAGDPMMHQYGQSGCEARRLMLAIADYRSGADQENGWSSRRGCFALTLDVNQRLDRLAEPHVIREPRPHPPPAEEPQPPVATLR